MKKIGFVDYYIDEWHANNYPVWFKELCEKTGKEFEVAYAWAEVDKLTEDGRSTAEWCKDFGVQKCDGIEELCEKSDYIIVLAPSNPEKHLEYAKQVLKYGKRTYIDKTFAPDYRTAKEIFDIAATHRAPFFSSSALRYADEWKDLSAQAVMTTGGGGNYEEYIVHQIEMAVKLLGVGAERVKLTQNGTGYLSQIAYGDNRAATLIYAIGFPFCAYVDKTDGGARYLPVKSDYFKNLLADILRFFETGERSFDGEETLEVMRIRESLIKAKEELGEWIPIIRN